MSVISLLNQHRLDNGLPTLGWAHPFLYDAYAKQKTTFIDITKGQNQYGCCSVGFSAVIGADPITGLGVPQFETLKAMSTSMFNK